MVQSAFLTHSEMQTERLGEALAHRLCPGCVVLLVGDLGAGKTAFARGVARGLGTGGVSSPTFTLLNVYEGGRLPLYHIDAYRLSCAQEAEDAGLDEAVFGGGVCLIEWPQNIGAMLPKDALRVTISHLGEDKRKIALEAPFPLAVDFERTDTDEAAGH